MDRSRNWKELLEIYKLQDKIESLEKENSELKNKNAHFKSSNIGIGAFPVAKSITFLHLKFKVTKLASKTESRENLKKPRNQALKLRI